jgi:hypothetical protein
MNSIFQVGSSLTDWIKCYRVGFSLLSGSHAQWADLDRELGLGRPAQGENEKDQARPISFGPKPKRKIVNPFYFRDFL